MSFLSLGEPCLTRCSNSLVIIANSSSNLSLLTNENVSSYLGGLLPCSFAVFEGSALSGCTKRMPFGFGILPLHVVIMPFFFLQLVINFSFSYFNPASFLYTCLLVISQSAA